MEDRSQYLRLAQISQGVVKSVLRYLEGGDWDTLSRTISGIVGPLEALASPGTGSHSADRSAFTTYEQVSTITEAWETPESQLVVARLKKLLQVGDSPDAQREAAELIASFHKLSTQALWNFEQPDLGLPRGVFELCKAP
jgi:hypothetical protein